MKPIRLLATGLLAVLPLLPGRALAQEGRIPTPDEVANTLGFNSSEIARIKGGEVISKGLAEGSDKELAGVVAAFFPRPLDELADKTIAGKFLEMDPTMQVKGWDPDTPAAAQFAGVALTASEGDEAGRFRKASKGSKLNLSAAEVDQFRNAGGGDGVNAQLRAALMARYEAYRSRGLRGIPPYARGGSSIVAPSDELALAIRESLPGRYLPGYRKALLNYPGDALPGLEHRFYWYKQQVEDRPTFILADRTSMRTANAAVLTEMQYYVGHSYNSNFVACAGFSVQGGTLVFYMNRTFTDQVAGFASGMRHSIGRKQMLESIVDNLKHIRDEASK